MQQHNAVQDHSCKFADAMQSRQQDMIMILQNWRGAGQAGQGATQNRLAWEKVRIRSTEQYLATLVTFSSERSRDALWPGLSLPTASFMGLQVTQQVQSSDR